MNFKPPPKRKKVDPSTGAASSSQTQCTLVVNLPSEKMDTTVRKPMVHQTQTSNVVGVGQRIQHLRNNAVAQAQQDGCTANFRIFDSAFGNFLVPVIPTRSELGG